MNFHTLNYALTCLLLLNLLKINTLNAQSGLEKKKDYNPALIEERINSEPKKTYILGKVIDKASREPLVGATVKLTPKGWVAYTDLNGYFEFLNVPPDTFELEVYFIGYKKTKFLNLSTLTQQFVECILPIELLVSESESVAIENLQYPLLGLSTKIWNKYFYYLLDAQTGIQQEKENFDYHVATGFQRMSGAIFNNNQLWIRGLPEKYNAVLLNGAPLLNLSPQYSFYNLNDFPSNIISNLLVIKSSTPEIYSNYGGGIIQLETEKMPIAHRLKLQWNSGYHSYTTFRTINSFPINRKLFFLQETQNIKIHAYSLKNPFQVDIPNYSILRHHNAMPSSQWNIYLAKRYSAFSNKELGIVAALNFTDYSQRVQWKGSDLLYSRHDGIYLRSFENSDGDKKYQNTCAILNASLKWNSLNYLYSQNTFIYKTENQVFNQFTDFNYYHSQIFQRTFVFAQQNSGQHGLVTKKDRSLRFEWQQFYHYYYQQIPAQVHLYFEKKFANQMILDLPDTSNFVTEKKYHQNKIYAEKQNVHQMGGDAYFDIMIKEEDRKAKTRIGTFIYSTHYLFNSRAFHYHLNNNFLDSSWLSINYISTYGLINPNREIFYQPYELTDTSYLFQAQHFNIVPYIHIHYELSDILGFIIGFREDLSFRKIYNYNRTKLLENAVQSDLPSLSIWIKTQQHTWLKLHYMMTVTRPTDRDLIGTSFYHPITQMLQQPNPQLMHSTINHINIRYETYPNSTNCFSTNLFFKRIFYPIENYYFIPKLSEQAIIVTTSNANTAILGGFEWDYKYNLGKLFNLKIFEKFFIQANGYASYSNTKSQSQMKFFSEGTRPLQGHTNYGLNFGWNWILEDWGLKVMSFINHKGKNIHLVHSQNPAWNLWELQRTDWSFQISKSYLSHWEFRLAIFNLLNQPIQWVYLSKNHYFKNDIQSVFRIQHLGRQFLFAVNYRL